MQLKRTLFAGGLASMLLLAACNGESTEDAGTKEEQPAEETSDESSEGVSYSGVNGDYSFSNFTPVKVPAKDAEGNDTEIQAVAVEFEFENTSDRAATPSEAFSLDLAVRQVSEDGEAPTENYTMDLEDDGEFKDGKAASSELVEPGESATAVVAYGPLDPELATHLQARENPLEETESMDHEIELDLAPAEESEEDSEE
ncbi:hypothetical protein GCM10007275_00780 [Jeotgalicoccus coquinae]|uniref:DUF5067 domain-containing protein n=1 Tax=Jeotgalicoccus coquinae TaxID=709509 RepID=A0A6V7RRT1_9STAP|nr:DUF5067 domain-containing protein [Jeotgalicoccus coquinae]MBB6423257.1 hypothetical protein [Jeotgalicoccus coquinae]GGE09441.1 hypothetical protein GCM10007275_00780 [Jeotgalicoccus coquinae]CAD2081871.1 hypothetical protein JEOCOQ751_02200 [Jeotgalicoccus coquinae]